MATRVRKELLRAGTYHTGHGPVTFGPDDLREMEATGNAMLAAGLAVPVPLEHQDVTPLSHADRLAASVRHNAGWVAGFSLSGDGGLYADLDVEDDDIAKKLPTTIKYVSPQVHPVFVDGAGREWRNAVTHVALTPQPVWASQRPFSGDGAALLSLADVPDWSSWGGGPLRLSLADAWRFGVAIRKSDGKRIYGQQAARAVAAGTATPAEPARKPRQQQPAQQQPQPEQQPAPAQPQQQEQQEQAPPAVTQQAPAGKGWHDDAQGLLDELEQTAVGSGDPAVVKRYQQIRGLLQAALKEREELHARIAKAEQVPAQAPQPAAAQTPKPQRQPRAPKPKPAPAPAPDHVATPAAAASRGQAHKAISDAYDNLTLFHEFQDGLVAIPRLYQEAKDRDPSLTLQQFHKHLEDLSQSRAIDLKVLNEESTAENPELAITRGDGADKHLYYFVLPRQGKKFPELPEGMKQPAPTTAKTGKPAAPPAPDHAKTLAAVKGKSLEEATQAVLRVGASLGRGGKAKLAELATQHGVAVKKSWTANQIGGALARALAGGPGEAKPAGQKAPEKPAAKPAASAGDKAHSAIARAIGDVPVEDLGAVRKRLPEALRGEAFDKAIEAMAEAGLIDVASDVNPEADGAKSGWVKVGKNWITTAGLTDKGKKLLGGEKPAAEATKPAGGDVAAHVEALKKLYDGTGKPEGEGRTTYEQIDSAVGALRKLPDADVAAVAEAVGLKGKRPKGEAINRIRERLRERLGRSERGDVIAEQTGEGKPSRLSLTPQMPSVERLPSSPTLAMYHRLSRGDGMAEENDDLFAGLEELDDAPAEGTPPEEPVAEPAAQAAEEMAEASAELKALGVEVEPADDPETFLKHLCTALRTHKSTKALHGDDDANTPLTPPAEEPQPGAAPVAMSLRVQNLERELAAERLGKVNAKVNQLVAEGRASAAQAKRWKADLGARRLSLVGGKEDVRLAVTLGQIEAAGELPKGTYWDAGRKAQLSRAAQEPEPEGLYGPDPEKEAKDQQEVIAEMAAMAGVPRGKK